MGVGDTVLKTKTSDFYSLVPSCPLPIFFTLVVFRPLGKRVKEEQTSRKDCSFPEVFGNRREQWRL